MNIRSGELRSSAGNSLGPSILNYDISSQEVSLLQDRPSSSAGNLPNWTNNNNFHLLLPPNSTPLDPNGWGCSFSSCPLHPPKPPVIQHTDSLVQYRHVPAPNDVNFDASFLDLQFKKEQDRQPLPMRRANPLIGQESTQAKMNDSKKAPVERCDSINAGNSASTKDPPNPIPNGEDTRRAKFLERNCIAASKCRQKKIEWTYKLENQAREKQKQNCDMRMMVASLREEILFLKGEMLKHNSCNCVEIQKFMQKYANALLLDDGAGVSPALSKKKKRVTFKDD